MTTAEAARAILDGKVVAYPTESSWGLGVDASSTEALARLFAIKAREEGKPPLALVVDEAMVAQLARVVPARARAWMTKFWPGPLTIVLPARGDLSAAMVKDGGVGIRHAPHEVASALVRAVGKPITSSSANPSGQAPAMNRAEVRAYFGGSVEVLDDGEAGGAAPSTVAAVDENGNWKILRPGPITKAQLEETHG